MRKNKQSKQQCNVHITMATNQLIFSSPSYSSKSLFLQSCYSFFLLLLLCPISENSPLNPHSLTFPQIPYSEHCNHIVQESPIDPSVPAIKYRSSLTFDVSFFSGGDSFFNTDESWKIGIKSAKFLPISLQKTLGDGEIYKVDARLTLKITRVLAPSYYGGGGFGQKKFQVTQIDGQRIPMSTSLGPRFDLSGFWSESTGQVCMVGSTSGGTNNLKFLNARLMLNYSMDSNIYGSLVKGVLESLSSDKNNQNYFETISILGARETPYYNYKLLEETKSDCGINVQETLSLESEFGGLCKVFGAGNHVFNLMYRAGCGSDHNCSPFGNDLAYTPDSMSLLSFQCDRLRMRILLSFRNSTSFKGPFPFDPSTTLIAEGAWDVQKNSFCGVACRILNFSDSLSNAIVDDCSLRFSLRFPAVLSIRAMSHVIAQLWSVKPQTDPGYFKRIEFSSVNDPLWRFPTAKYRYTETERLGKLCGARKKLSKSKGKHYPDAQTSDMRFVMSVKYTGEGNVLGSARASPYFVGDWLYQDLLILGQGDVVTVTPMDTKHMTKSFTNITYRIRFLDLTRPNTSISRGDIYAEGTYDRNTGELCMVGCQTIRSKNTVGVQTETKDCSLAIKFKFSPIDSKSDERLMGTIESTRDKTDPLYIGRMLVSSRSIYSWQAKESVWRMDLELVMVLLSNTLSCVFVGMQLYHMKKHQETRPFISLLMLLLLTLGHMIPLLLHFEEFFKSSKYQQSLFFDNDKWIEAKQIMVRIVTLIAFLLECRLLQLAWTTRRNTEEHNRNTTWTAERKVSYVCVPLIFTGGLISWLVNRTRPRKRTVYFRKPRSRHLLYRPVNLKRSIQRPSLWKDMESYGGLMHDGFLLPQILFNAFSNSDTKSLATSFYAGNSIVRLLPHVYDLYRSHSYGEILDWSFIYANHRLDYYSTAWDVIIICICVLFALLVFLQQRFGGRCFLPMRFKENAGYEKVVELQETGDQQNSNDS